MLRSSSSRGQTEPIAAIVAVSALVVGISIYAVFVSGALPGTSDSATADPTIDRIWSDLEDGGVFHAHSDGIETVVDESSLPRGDSVYVRVSAIDDGAERVVAEAVFDADGAPRSLDSEEPPSKASAAERSIPVAVDNRAEIRSGTLRVEVW